jgi:hypothetical protein
MMRLQDAVSWNKSTGYECRSKESSILAESRLGQPILFRFGYPASHPQTNVVLAQPSTGNHCFFLQLPCPFTGNYHFFTTLA